MQTRAAVLRQVGGPIGIEMVELEAPRAGEVLVKVAAAGVCHSDWHIVSGATQHPLPVVLGLIVVAAVRRVRPRPMPAAARDAVIEGEWVVLDPGRRDRG